MATQAEKERRAAKQLRMKLRLEAELRARMRRFFGKQNRRFLGLFENTGLTLNMEEFRPELFNILFKHYDKTGRKFHRLVMREINQALRAVDQLTIDDDHPELVGLLLAFAAESVAQSVDQILGTSQKQINQALQDTGRDARASYEQLQTHNLPRANTIAATETQKASEGSKGATVRQAQNIVAGGLTAAVQLEALKEWVPRNDTKVRPAHEAARFQRQPEKLPFVVGGEFLMYPGDWSLGASPWNLVNCRCVALYFFGVLI